MLIAFKLSMPNNNSWDGKWSGEGRLYCVVKSVSDKKGAEILAKRSYYYGWNDGWGASISVEEVTPQESKKLRKDSLGFYGYEWMIETIVLYGKPLADHQIGPFLESQKAKTADAVTAK